MVNAFPDGKRGEFESLSEDAVHLDEFIPAEIIYILSYFSRHFVLFENGDHFHHCLEGLHQLFPVLLLSIHSTKLLQDTLEIMHISEVLRVFVGILHVMFHPA